MCGSVGPFRCHVTAGRGILASNALPSDPVQYARRRLIDKDPHAALQRDDAHNVPRPELSEVSALLAYFSAE